MIAKTDKIVITGATGFIGSYILRYFYNQGYTNIHATKRASSSMDMLGTISDKIQWVEADILDIPNLTPLIEGAALVIHAAAMVSFQKKDNARMLKVNVEGTANIVNLCLDADVKKLLYVSSVAAIGKNEISNTITEKQEWENDELNSPYSVSKYLAELEVWRGKEEGLDVAMINPGVVLGAGRWTDSSLEIIHTVAKGVQFYPRGTNGFVDVRDVAKMMFLLLDKNISGERMIAVSESIKIRDLIWTIADKIKAKKASIEVKPWMIPLAWRMASLIGFVTRKRPFITKPTLHTTSKDWYYENQKSKELLGIEYIPLDQTITDMCDAYNKSVSDGKDFGVLPV